MIEQVAKNTPKRMKAESSYNPIALGDILETEMGDMTRAAFARKLGITRPSLDKYLSAVRGGIAPSCEALCLMADNLGCSVDYLLGRTAARVPEKAIAMDELQLSETAVAVVHGEAPHQKSVLRSLPELPADDLDHTLETLSTRQSAIHETIAALLENPDFEFAMITLERARDFAVTDGESWKIKKRIDDILRGGVSISTNGEFVISGEKAERLLRDTIRSHLDAAVEAVINKNAAPAEEPKR